MTQSALVLFSGGQDSTVCLAWALERYGWVETVGFDYGQRHGVELAARDQVRALLIVTPLTFLGGTFYSVQMLPPIWQTVTLFNPVVYLISGFRWSFYGIADVSLGLSLGMTACFLAVSLGIVVWIFRTGYRLKT